MAIHQNSTDEWKESGVTELRDYAIFKREREKLHDHMTDLELIFTMLGERVTAEVSQQEKPEGFEESRKRWRCWHYQKGRRERTWPFRNFSSKFLGQESG